MRIAAHESKPIDKHGPLSREGMDKIRKVLALHHAMVLKTRDGVISQLERPFFDAGKPAFKAREIERILLAGIDEDHRAWRLELSATAFCKNRNRGVRYGHCRHLPFQRGCNCAVSFHRRCLMRRSSPGGTRDATHQGPA